jgi:hypothetical protein
MDVHVAAKGSLLDAPTSLLPQLGALLEGITRTAHKARRTPHTRTDRHRQTDTDRQTQTDTDRHTLRLAAWVPHLYVCRSDAGTLGIGWTALDTSGQALGEHVSWAVTRRCWQTGYMSLA